MNFKRKHIRYANVSIEQLTEAGIKWNETKPNTAPDTVYANVAHAIVHNGDKLDKRGIVYFPDIKAIPEGIEFSVFDFPVEYFFWREYHNTTVIPSRARSK